MSKIQHLFAVKLTNYRPGRTQEFCLGGANIYENNQISGTRRMGLSIVDDNILKYFFHICKM